MVKTCELLAGGVLLGLRRQVVQDPGRLCIVCTDGGWKLRSYGLSKPDASPDAPLQDFYTFSADQFSAMDAFCLRY